MAHGKKTLTHEQAYVKAMLKEQREEVGFVPSRTHESHEAYRRSRYKRGCQLLPSKDGSKLAHFS